MTLPLCVFLLDDYLANYISRRKKTPAVIKTTFLIRHFRFLVKNLCSISLALIIIEKKTLKCIKSAA